MTETLALQATLQEAADFGYLQKLSNDENRYYNYRLLKLWQFLKQHQTNT